MSRWPTVKHFTSWLALSPGSKISGGKVLSSRTRRTKNRAAALLRLAATTIGRSQTGLGAFYRRLAVYQDPGTDYYEERYHQRIVRNLQRRAQSLGFELAPIADPSQRVS